MKTADTFDALSNNRFIITGGPGSGKTTLIEGLKKLGYCGFPEIARDLIRLGADPPIRSNNHGSGRFFNLILQNRIFLHQQIKGTELGFYDRGIPDSLAYFKFLGKKVPGILTEAIKMYRYHTIVFVTPPWEEIFRNDSVRRETFAEAQALHDLTVEAYESSGYQVMEMPRVQPEKRLELVIGYARRAY